MNDVVIFLESISKYPRESLCVAIFIFAITLLFVVMVVEVANAFKKSK